MDKNEELNQVIGALKSGILKPILEKVWKDIDLDLEIRNGYVDIYYKGNRLAGLYKNNPNGYKIITDTKFKEGLEIPTLLTEEDISSFINQVPYIKEKIIKNSKALEVEYQQRIVRACNFEKGNNCEYFVLDRSYRIIKGKRNEVDLVAFFWDTKKRKSIREVPLVFIEVKNRLDNRIQDLAKQVSGYYHMIEKNYEQRADYFENILKHKLELGLIKHPERKGALEKLSFSKKIRDAKFIIILVDYNPYSDLFKRGLKKLKGLRFSRQIKVFITGFGLWNKYMKSLGQIGKILINK